MKIHYFQHVPFEGLGCLETFFKKPGNSITATKFFEDYKLPFIDICDVLVVMGGPMGVSDEHKFPWLKSEKEFIKKAIDKGKKVIGICLGAQLIAEVLGARVYANSVKEIGWYPVSITEDGKNSILFSDFPETPVFHWHGDTFDLPVGAKNLLKSEGCKNQAFLYNNQVLALQFHLEMREHDIEGLIDNCKKEITKGEFIQTEEQIRQKDFIQKNNEILHQLLTRFLNA